jgi:hypothetical protein
MIITVNFDQQPPLYIKIQDTDVGQQYFELVKSNYQKASPVYRDAAKYTSKYMRQLAQQAQQAFGWNWHNVSDYSDGIGAQLHKDLEILLQQGFENIPEQHDDLVHELHYCLHLIQHGNKLQRPGWLQIEWYNDEGFDLDPNFKFSLELKIGDVRLQNPFVGHGPWQMWMEQDFGNISQTCKFHTFVKPGINIAHSPYELFTQFDQLIAQFQKNDPQFVELHGIEKIKNYTGHPVIGHILNIDDLLTVKNAPTLTLKELKFND